MKYSDDGRQYHIGLKAEDIGKYVILPGTLKDVKKSQPILKIQKK